MTNVTPVRRIAARPSVVFEAQGASDEVAAGWETDNLPIVSAQVDARGSQPEEDGRRSFIEFKGRTIDGGAELTFTCSQLRNEASMARREAGWVGAPAKLVSQLGPIRN
jgi:hypothetical protein